jgi:hypothetical protein
MAYKISKIDVWSAEIADRPGGLADVLEPLAAAGARLECLIARRQPDKAGTGVVYVTPIKGKKQQDAARAAGVTPATGKIATLRLEGPDSPGGGAAVCRAIQNAGINIRGLSGLKVGNKVVAYIGFDSDADADNAARAIKAIKNKAKAKAKTRKRR